VPKNTVEARISAMPLNGRSVRAGARRAAGFFSGNGKGALSSLAAAAGGGVTAISIKQKWESAKFKKRQLAPRDKVRKRDSDMHGSRAAVRRRVVMNC
jgi:hypothetical protein